MMGQGNNRDGLDGLLKRADEMLASLAIDDYKTLSVFLEAYDLSFLARIKETLFKNGHNGEISIVKRSNRLGAGYEPSNAIVSIYPDDFLPKEQNNEIKKGELPQFSDRQYADSQLFQYRIINKEGFASLLDFIVKNPSEKGNVQLKLVERMDPKKLPEMGGLQNE